ncbi:ABC transporter ATP-binding protein [Candidatus Bathyarchaeota archaeon]|nr:MAG: ABC transporter ATP-binding protein [Candidatus Bathyarchaeota archaeon]
MALTPAQKDLSQLPSEYQDALIGVIGLKKYFPVRQGFLSSIVSGQTQYVKAVDDVSFFVRKGEVFGLAGESGSGKSTTGRLLLRLTDITDGRVFFKGRDISKLAPRQLKPLRKEMQIIFKDPYESLDPRMTIKEIVAEPLRIQGIAKSEAEILERVKQILSEVEVVPPEEFLQRFPHELSGGQRQRVAVARAFVVNPEFVVADEPVSMLDVSIRAEVLNSMLELVQKRQVSFIYITHDLALAKHVCDRLAIMYLGKIVEMGPTDQVIMNPLHPYTQALIAAVPVPDPDYRRGNLPISGEIPSPLNPPQACRFHTRCPYAFPECTTLEPPLIEAEPGHFVACHMVHK